MALIKLNDFCTLASLCVSIKIIQVGKGVLPNSLISGSSILPNSHFLSEIQKLGTVLIILGSWGSWGVLPRPLVLFHYCQPKTKNIIRYTFKSDTQEKLLTDKGLEF